jgi:hypothetical protein
MRGPSNAHRPRGEESTCRSTAHGPAAPLVSGPVAGYVPRPMVRRSPAVPGPYEPLQRRVNAAPAGHAPSGAFVPGPAAPREGLLCRFGACCPWWSLGGGAVLAAAFALTGGGRWSNGAASAAEAVEERPAESSSPSKDTDDAPEPRAGSAAAPPGADGLMDADVPASSGEAVDPDAGRPSSADGALIPVTAPFAPASDFAPASAGFELPAAGSE